VADRETRDRVALLLRRAGFGASPAELERYLELGVEGTLDELLHPERVDEDFDGLLSSLSGHLIDLQNFEDVQTGWLYRMVHSRRRRRRSSAETSRRSASWGSARRHAPPHRSARFGSALASRGLDPAYTSCR